MEFSFCTITVVWVASYRINFCLKFSTKAEWTHAISLSIVSDQLDSYINSGIGFLLYFLYPIFYGASRLGMFRIVCFNTSFTGDNYSGNWRLPNKITLALFPSLGRLCIMQTNSVGLALQSVFLQWGHIAAQEMGLSVKVSAEQDSLSHMQYSGIYLVFSDMPDFTHQLAQVSLLKWGISSTLSSTSHAYPTTVMMALACIYCGTVLA